MKTSVMRTPAVAGMFYPAEAKELRAEVASFLSQAKTSALSPAPKALIAPHAGYVYSGPIAGSAYAALGASARAVIRRVIVLGPSHRVAFQGIATSGMAFFRTPLGDVPVDRAATATAESCRNVHVFERAHQPEHSLEVHLPFLQCIVEHFAIVPLVVGHASPSEVAAVIEALWGGEETLVVVSSDLSHYLPYARAQEIDRITSEAIARLASDELSFDQACGCLPIQGLLLAARQHRLKPHVLDLRNSGDTAGDRDSVVGYGAYAFN